MAAKPEGDGLAERIARILEIDSQYSEHVDPSDEARIARVRSAGRAAGRLLGWRVRTFQTDPETRDDGKVVVIVVAIESTPDDEARIRERSDLLLAETFKNL